MTLDQLKTFSIVANAGSFTSAAIELNMDQSNVSRKIIAMETRLRTKLFTRKARGLILTPEGQALLEETKEILTRIEGMKNIIKNVHNEASGLLNVNVLGSFSTKKTRPADVDFIVLLKTPEQKKKTKWSVDLVIAPDNEYGKFVLKDADLWTKEKYGLKKSATIKLR